MSDLKYGFHDECRKEIWQNAKARFHTRHSAAKVFTEVNYHFNLQAMHRQCDHFIIFCCCKFILFLKSANVQNSLLYRGSQALLFFLRMSLIFIFLNHGSSVIKIFWIPSTSILQWNLFSWRSIIVEQEFCIWKSDDLCLHNIYIIAHLIDW